MSVMIFLLPTQS